MAAFLVLALAAASLLLAIFWPSEGGITVAEGDWGMPGGTPAHTAYLPFAPKDSLSERWNTRMEAKLVGPPAVAGGRVYVCCEDGSLYCLELETGRPVWKYDTGGMITSMPGVFEGGILLATQDGRVIKLGPGGKPDWEIEVGGAVRSTPIPQKGRVYFGSSDNHLYCVSAEDGAKKWSFDAQSPVEVSPCLYEEQVFAASFEGGLFALNAADGKLNWNARTQGIPVACPTADNGRVFLATEFMVLCSDAQSGRQLWKYNPGMVMISNLAVRGNQLIGLYGTAGRSCGAVSLDARTGDQLWNVSAGESPVWTWLAATNEGAYASGPGRFYALSVESGMAAMERQLAGVLPQTITVTERHILVGTDSRKVYCFGE
jgi:outer membrane protein assembly factor BamB